VDVVNKDDKQLQPMKLESVEIASHPEPVIAQPVNVKVDPLSGTSVVVVNHTEPTKEINPFDNPFDFSNSNSKDDFLFSGIPEDNLFDYDVDADPFSFKDIKANLSILEPKDTFGFDITKLPFGGDDLFGSSTFPTTFSFAPSSDPLFS